MTVSHNHPHTLVVQAHPRHDSLSRALLDSVTDHLERQEITADVLRVGHGDRLTTSALADVATLVIVAPTWFGAMPAMLLDQLQRLLGPWVDAGQPASTSPMASIERLVVVTTHGSPKRINLLQGEPGKLLWERTVLPLCAPGAAFEWVSLYGVDRLERPAIETFVVDAGRRAVGATATSRSAGR